jgi:hypothetical protein
MECRRWRFSSGSTCVAMRSENAIDGRPAHPEDLRSGAKNAVRAPLERRRLEFSLGRTGRGPESVQEELT